MEQRILLRSISLHLLVLLAPALSYSQSAHATIKHVIASKVFGEERTIDVFLPEAYSSEDSTRTFMTAYVLDGQFEPYFTMVSSMMSYYEQTNEGIPMVIVGIHTTNRWDEFIPVEGQMDTAQGADRLSEFLRSEVIPLIEATYRVKPFRVGVGHSLGGTYVIHEMTKDNSLFKAGITASPNLTIDDEMIVRNAKDFFQRDPNNRRFFHTNAGTVGDMENDFRRSLLHLDTIARNIKLPHTYWNCTIGAGLGHMTTFVPCFNDGYLALSAKARLSDEELLRMAANGSAELVDALKAFHVETGEFLGESQAFGAAEAMDHANTLGQYDKHEHAMELCRYAERLLGADTLGPNGPFWERLKKERTWYAFNMLAEKARAQADLGDHKEASRSYKEAFASGQFKATHIARMGSVPVFAQTQDFEEAFKQLELLADTFKLGGNQAFTSDERCAPLHPDPRWKQLMDKLAENAKLYE